MRHHSFEQRNHSWGQKPDQLCILNVVPIDQLTLTGHRMTSAGIQRYDARNS